MTANAEQGNKHIGDCHGWLMMRSGSPTVHYGVTVSPTTAASYDQVTYRALDVYFTGGDDYFDWWNQMIVSASDLYGLWSDPHKTALAARDAIGGWTGLQTLPVGVTGVHTNDRFAAVGWDGAPRGPCVFYRYSGSTTQIYYSCRDTSGWSSAAPFNDVGVDPAASEPTAAYRYESGHFIYVLWRGTDDRIHYRLFDPQTLTIGPSLDLGGSANRLTSGPVAAASIFESASTDRLVIVYHPKSQPTWYFATHLGSSTVTDLGPAVDATSDPTLVAFPYFEWTTGTNRIYFVRPDATWSATPGHLRHLSYSLAGGWSSTPQSLTDQFSGEPGMLANVVRTDRGVALAEYNRSTGTTRLRMAFVTTGDETGGQRELWYATFRQSTPGTLERAPGYRAVPLAPVGSGTHQSAGGLALGTERSPLYHFWGDSGPVGKLASWQTFSD